MENNEAPCLVAYPETSETLWMLGDLSETEAFRKLDSLLQERGYARFVLSNDAHCHICGQIVSSAHRHDCSTCRCGNITVDGGHDYATRTWMTNRYDDLAVFGWVPSEAWYSTVTELTSNPQTLQAAQLAALKGAAARTFEVIGTERESGAAVKDAHEARAPFEAAWTARRERKNLCVERIRDLSMPPRFLDLLDELDLGSVTAEACLAEDVAEWAEATGHLLGSVHVGNARNLLASYLATRIGQSA